MVDLFGLCGLSVDLEPGSGSGPYRAVRLLEVAPFRTGTGLSVVSGQPEQTVFA